MRIINRNLSAKNSQSLFAWIGFFGIINSSGKSSKKTSKRDFDLRLRGVRNSTKVPRFLWKSIQKRKKEERSFDRSSCVDKYVKALFYNAFMRFSSYLKYLLSIPSRALPWRASSWIRWVLKDFKGKLKAL